MRKHLLCAILVLLAALSLTCAAGEQAIQGGEAAMRLSIDGREVPVQWEENESVAALRALAAEAPVTVEMSMYGGFEQVGPLGTSLPRNDVQTTTRAGDIVLYSGDQVVVFYGSNAWAYTRLGRIEGMDAEALTDLLGRASVTLTFTVG